MFIGDKLDNDLKDREKIRYQYMLNRIQNFKYLVVTTILAMMAYTANSIDNIENLVSLCILVFAVLILLISFYFASIDAGASIFYNEKSQDGINKRQRLIMYCLILFSAILIFTSKINNTYYKLENLGNSKLSEFVSKSKE